MKKIFCALALMSLTPSICSKNNIAQDELNKQLVHAIKHDGSIDEIHRLIENGAEKKILYALALMSLAKKYGHTEIYKLLSSKVPPIVKLKPNQNNKLANN